MKLKVNEEYRPLFLDNSRYKILMGGRGGGVKFVKQFGKKSIVASQEKEMKQHITIDQLKKLTPESIMRLQEWYYPKKQLGDIITYRAPLDPNVKWAEFVLGMSPLQGDPIPLLSIGQMIEFLSEYGCVHITGAAVELNRHIGSTAPYINIRNMDTLCDALWEAVKSVLEQDGKKG